VLEETKAARRKSGGGEHGFRVLPASLARVLGEIIASGRRPHNCEYCQHPPTGGVSIDADASKEAAKLAQETLGSYPVPMMIVVGEGMTTPFSVAKRGGGGGGKGSVGRRPLPPVGTKLTGGPYKGTSYEAEIVEHEGEPAVLFMGKHFKSLSASIQDKSTLSYQQSGNRFWTWDGKEDDEE